MEYRTRLDLIGQAADDPVVCSARAAMIAHPQVQGLLSQLAAWPGPPLKRHNDAGHLVHKLTFIADIGLDVADPGVRAIVDRILERQSAEGPFQVLLNIATSFGGRGEDELAWILCDASTVVYALVKLDAGADPRLHPAIAYLAGLSRDNGWPCAATASLGRFHGPGRRADPCPYATLIMLKLLAQLPAWRESACARTGAQTILDLWQRRREQRPYLFAMGQDYTKLKAPLVWYDILHVLDVLTQFPWLHNDARVHELMDIVWAKSETGRFTPESVWRAWADWDVGQKHRPSPWLTLAAHRIARRLHHS